MRTHYQTPEEKGFCYTVTEILAGFCRAVMQKAELVSKDLECPAEISKQSAEGADMVLSPQSEIQEETQSWRNC